MSKRFHKWMVLFPMLVLSGLPIPMLAADTQAPGITSIVPAPGSTLPSLRQIVITFDEPVLEVDPEDLLINGFPALSLTNTGNAYYFTVPFTAPGGIKIAFNSNHAIADYSGNGFDAALPGHSWTYTLQDVVAPSMTIVWPVPGASLTRLDTIELFFSEPVIGLDSGDLLINGLPAATLTGSSLGPYRFRFPPAPEGVVEVAWVQNHGIQDFAQTPNAFHGSNWSYSLLNTNTVGSVIINEFLANNVRNITNEFGEAEDWIELFNPGPNPIRLLGWSLTDDPEKLPLWVLPDVTLNSGEYLLVFADGHDLKAIGINTFLHTNFRLNHQGEYLALCNADFPPKIISEFVSGFPEQPPDYSYGLNPTGGWSYLPNPTPGKANGSSSIVGMVPTPQVSASRGLYQQPFTLLASCSLPGASLRFTTDGSQPTELNGFSWPGSLQITNTTVLRIAAFASNNLPSHVVTHSYIFLDSILHQPNNPPGYPAGTNVWSNYPSDYEMDPEIVTNQWANVTASLLALPTLAVSMKVDDLFGKTNGIYTNPEQNPTNRYLWERPCSAEFILTNGVTGFQVDCGIRIQGNASRTPVKTPKHPFRLSFRGDYGPGRLDYPLFPESPVQSFNDLVLRADYNNSWIHYEVWQRLRGSKIRDAWGKETFRLMNGISGHSRPFHLYLNGLYWGVYDFGERIDAHFAASYLGGSPEEWDAIASKPTEAIDGDLKAYSVLTNIGLSTNLREPTNYLLLQKHLDLPVFLDYMILNFYGANLDWGFDGNWNALHRRTGNGTFKYVVWDAEQLIVSNLDNRVTSPDLPSGLHTNLVKSFEYRMDFADRVHRYCFNGGLLTPESAANRWMDLAQRVAPGVLAESARWGDYRRDVKRYSSGPYDLYTTNRHLWPEIQRMRTNYFPNRTDIFLAQLRGAGLYPSVAAPVFSQHGGRVPSGYALSMLATNAIYYTTNGTDPRVSFSGAISADVLPYSDPLSITSSLLVKARALSGTNWSALNQAFFEVPVLGSPLHITEIMYHPIGDEPFEFLELQNRGSNPLDVSGWTFRGITYSFPGDTILYPGQIIVLANNIDPAAFAIRYPDASVFGYFGGKLDNAGERISLHDQTGKIVLSVDYLDSAGWPKEADGQGYSLELIDPFGDPDSPANWLAANYAGTSGAVPNFGDTSNPIIAASPVLLNELMAENNGVVSNEGSFPDWVELHNSSLEPVTIAGWSLTDDSNPRKFAFPTNTQIEALGYLVVWCDTNFALPGLHSGFSLNKHGETLSLYTPTNRVDVVSFGHQINGYTLGRTTNRWILNVPTPGSNNQEAPLASATNLCLNEWLANSDPLGVDWIELFNRASEPVCLAGVYLAHSNGLHQLRALSFVEPHGHHLLLADESSGIDHLDFKLPADGNEIVLMDELGLELDRVTYVNHLQGISEGRLPDGFPAIATFFTSPSPGAANYQPTYSGPIINELMALNHTSLTNAAGLTPDWIELHNPTDADFDLTGFRLSTAIDNPDQWIFPPGVVLHPREYRVIEFNKVAPPSSLNEPVLNTGHALSGDGEEVCLFDANGFMVDRIKFGPQAAEYSLGRTEGQWKLLSIPTPGAANAPAAVLGSPATLRLNEWLASPLPDQVSFFEIYNPGSDPIELSGLFVTDDLSLPGLTRYQLPDLSFIGPRGFATITTGLSLAPEPNHLNFTLNTTAGSLRLSSSVFATLDTVYYGLQQPGLAEGRYPDGAPEMGFFECPTPGTGNTLAGPIIITVQPATQYVPVNSNVTFQVTLSSIGTASYQWFRNDNPIPGANAPVLQLTNAQVEAIGEYWVVVSNVCGTATSARAALLILNVPGGGWPVITAQPQSRTNTIGEPAQFSVTASSPLPLAYQWQFNGTDLSGQTNQTLRIDRVTSTHAGQYQVSLRNLAGAVFSDIATLTIIDPPRLETLRLLPAGNAELVLTGQPFRTYLIDWSPDLVNWSTPILLTPTNTPQTLLLPPPPPARTGFYRVRLIP